MSRPADILPTDTLVAILGAGRASRFGADKLSQSCAGKPLGLWALEAAQAIGLPLVWVAGEQAPAFLDGIEVIANPRAAEGISTSVALAAKLAGERGAGALLVMLADMPLVTPALLERLIAAQAPAACRQADGRPGVPALIPASAYPALMALTGDRGAGAVLAKLDGLTLLTCEASELLDVDTPEALAEAERLLTHS